MIQFLPSLTELSEVLWVYAIAKYNITMFGSHAPGLGFIIMFALWAAWACKKKGERGRGRRGEGGGEERGEGEGGRRGEGKGEKRREGKGKGGEEERGEGG